MSACSVIVAVCDRSGRLLARKVVTGTQAQCTKTRIVEMERFLREFPDGQVYFNWVSAPMGTSIAGLEAARLRRRKGTK